MTECKICEIRMPPQASMIEHAEKEHPQRCGICQATLLPAESVSEHVTSTHPEILTG